MKPIEKSMSILAPRLVGWCWIIWDHILLLLVDLEREGEFLSNVRIFLLDQLVIFDYTHVYVYFVPSLSLRARLWVKNEFSLLLWF